ncbi:hypothetical protein D3C84_489350 [compost metagenome]
MQHRLAVAAEGIAYAFTDVFGVGAVGGQYPAAGHDQHVPGTVEQCVLGVDGSRLQRVEGDVDTDHADGFAIDQQRYGNGGHQHFLAVDGVGVRVQQAGAFAVAWAGVPTVVGRATEVQGGFGHVVFDHDRVDLLTCGAAPVAGKASGLVGHPGGVVGELAVLAVQGVGFVGQPDTQHPSVAFEGGFQALVQRLTQGPGVERAVSGHGAQVRHLIGEGGHHQQAFAERLLYPYRLLRGPGLQQVLDTGGQHLCAGSADKLIVLIGLVDVHTDNQPDHTQQAQSGQQHDFKADGKRVEHGAISRMDDWLASGRCRPLRQIHSAPLFVTSAYRQWA